MPKLESMNINELLDLKRIVENRIVLLKDEKLDNKKALLNSAEFATMKRKFGQILEDARHLNKVKDKLKFNLPLTLVVNYNFNEKDFIVDLENNYETCAENLCKINIEVHIGPGAKFSKEEKSYIEEELSYLLEEFIDYNYDKLSKFNLQDCLKEPTRIAKEINTLLDKLGDYDIKISELLKD